MIYTVGDSHCWHGWMYIPGVVVHPRGGMTMHRFGKARTNVVRDIPEGAIVVFCWGEIDCRNHIHNHQPWEETVDRVVSDYLETIRFNATLKQFKDIWIYNVPPPKRMDGRPNLDKSFPFVGSDADRLKYVKRMNQRLKESEFKVVDIYDHYADEEGFMIQEKSDGHVHIADIGPLAEWVKKNVGD